MTVRDPDDPTGRRCLLMAVKSNLAALAPTLAYHIESVDGWPRVVYEGQSALTALGLARGQDGQPLRESALDRAVAFLRRALADGPRPSTEVEAEADAE